MSRILALAHKGHELGQKAHYARAAEKYSRAAEEAEKALPVPDCLVACALRVLQLDTLLSHATASAAEPADAHDALREACLRLLPSAVAVLERRKAAGTLLPGSCRPEEEAYQRAVKRHKMELAGYTQAYATMEAAELAPLVGVDTYYRAATSVAFMLEHVYFSERAFVLSDEQKHAAYLYITSAVKLMARPRDFDGHLSCEPELVRRLRMLIPRLSDADEPAVRKLCAAWRRLLRSGVLRARGIDEGIDEALQVTANIRANAAAEAAARGLRECALAGCASKEVHVSQFKKCGACRTVCYCCREHQLEDWHAHKAACKAARKTAADPPAK